MKVKSFVFRSIKETDAPHIIQLSKEAKSGLSNLPKTLDKAKQLINISQLSIQNKLQKKDQKFIFVVETNEKEIVGISGIKSHVGVERPYYSFHLNKTENHPYLELTQQPLGPTEIGSLFLSPRYRNQNIGRLLSLSRFLFIRCFKKQFTNVIIAELRGFLYKNNTSPIWNAIGKKFIPLSFNKADIRSMTDLTFIDTYFPKNPIYLSMIDSKAIPYLGAVHPYTEPAKKLLFSEYFKSTNYIDIFDGGPKLECLTSNIRSIANSKQATVSQLSKTLTNDMFIICNLKYNNFRCIRATKTTSKTVIKHQLKLTDSDPVVYVKERE